MGGWGVVSGIGGRKAMMFRQPSAAFAMAFVCLLGGCHKEDGVCASSPPEDSSRIDEWLKAKEAAGCPPEVAKDPK